MCQHVQYSTAQYSTATELWVFLVFILKKWHLEEKILDLAPLLLSPEVLC